MGIVNPKPKPVVRKVFPKALLNAAPSAIDQGFKEGRNYFPGMTQPAVKKLPPLPVSQATNIAPTSAQIVANAAGVAPRVVIPAGEVAAAAPQLAQFTLPASSVTGVAPASRIGGVAATRGIGAVSAVPQAATVVTPAEAAVTQTAGTTANVAKKGRIAGLLSRVPFATPAAEATGGRILGTGGALAAGSVGRGLGYAGAGYYGGKLAEGITGEQDGTWDDTLQYGITGAGIGAGIGSVIFPGVGTAIGAGAGALIGGIGGALFGEDKSDARRKTEELSKATNEANTGARNYMKIMGVSTGDQDKILAQLQFQSGGLKKDELPALYNELLPQYVDAATQLSGASAQATLAEQARTRRQAAVQAYLMPQLNKYLGAAQTGAEQLDQQSVAQGGQGSKYGYLQAQTNAAYLSQLAALTTMANASQQPTQQNPTLEDYLRAQLAASQAPLEMAAQ